MAKTNMYFIRIVLFLGPPRLPPWHITRCRGQPICCSSPKTLCNGGNTRKWGCLLHLCCLRTGRGDVPTLLGRWRADIMGVSAPEQGLAFPYLQHFLLKTFRNVARIVCTIGRA